MTDQTIPGWNSEATVVTDERFGGPADPELSVVVVTYETSPEELHTLLTALSEQTVETFETVVVDNGTGWEAAEAVATSPAAHRYIELDRNHGPTTARNVGVARASGDLFVFLDDDAVPRPGFLAGHRRVWQEHDAVAARGKVIPRTPSVYNRLQTWYDLGDDPFPFVLNIEGNACVDSDALKTVGGFDEQLSGRAGHEGIELTYRLVQAGYSRDRVLYTPDPVIEHDYALSLRQYVPKKASLKQARRTLENRNPELFEFLDSYETPDETTRTLQGTDRVLELVIAALVRVVMMRRSDSGSESTHARSGPQ